MQENNSNNQNTTNEESLLPYEQMFVNEYIRTGKIKESAKTAYTSFYKTYHEDGWYSYLGQDLLKQPKIINKIREMTEEIKEVTADLETKGVADAAEVLMYFSQVMRGEIKDQFGLEASLSERTKAATELARRTVDIDQKLKMNEAANEAANKAIEVTINWERTPE